MTANVRSIERCIDVLDLLSSGQQALTVSEIARRLGAPKSTMLTITRTLVARGLLALDPQTKQYRLGLGLARYRVDSSDDVDLSAIARPHLQRLAEDTRETATLAVVQGSGVYYLDRALGDDPLQYVVPVGIARPLHSTAGGKIALAWMSAEDRDRCLGRRLEKYTERTITDSAALARELARIRRERVAVARGETTEHLFGVAAPVFDRDQTLLASINLGGPRFRLQRNQARYVAAVRATAEAVSSEIARIGRRVRVPDANAARAT